MKRIIAAALALALMLSLGGCAKDKAKEEATSAEKESRSVGTYNTVEEGGLRFRMPDYFGDPEMSGDVKNYYAEKGNALTVLQMYSVDGILDEDSFESDCKEVYDSYVSGIKDSDGVTDFQEGDAADATLDCGLHCMIYTYSFTMSDVSCNTILTLINNTESNKVIMTSITQSQQSEYDYTDVYTEMIDTCELLNVKPETTDSPDSEEDSSDADSGLISPEFKKTMDDYEAWFDHYCEVMKKYKEDPSDLELMSEMADLISEETTMLEQMDNMDQSDMNAAELAYYLEVTARIEKKLLEVAY